MERTAQCAADPKDPTTITVFDKSDNTKRENGVAPLCSPSVPGSFLWASAGGITSTSFSADTATLTNRTRENFDEAGLSSLPVYLRLFYCAVRVGLRGATHLIVRSKSLVNTHSQHTVATASTKNVPCMAVLDEIGKKGLSGPFGLTVLMAGCIHGMSGPLVRALHFTFVWSAHHLSDEVHLSLEKN